MLVKIKWTDTKEMLQIICGIQETSYDTVILFYRLFLRSFCTADPKAGCIKSFLLPQNPTEMHDQVLAQRGLEHFTSALWLPFLI